MRWLAAMGCLGLLGAAGLHGAAPQQQRDDASTDAAFARMTAGLTLGRSSHCLSHLDRDRSSLRAVGDRLVFRRARDLLFVTRTNGGCDHVGDTDILVTVTPSTQLCRGDIARTVDRGSGITTGSCAMGDFVRYARP